MNNKWVSYALNAVRQKPIFSSTQLTLTTSIAYVMTWLTLLSKEDVKLIKYAFNLAGGSQKLLPLSLLTTWHHEPARYPPLGKRDYWDPDVYKEGTPYVDALPELIDTARSTIKCIIGACKSLKP